MGLAEFTTLPAAPSVFTPLAASIAQTIGWSVDGVVLAQIPSFVIFALPHQAPPVLVGLTLLKIPLREAMRFFIFSFLLGAVVLIPPALLLGTLFGLFPIAVVNIRIRRNTDGENRLRRYGCSE